MTVPVNSGDIYTDVSSLQSLKRDAAQGSPAALAKTAQQFEAMFLQMMLKSMRKAAPSDGMFDSDQTRFYQDMYDQQIAIDMAKKKQLGIANLLVQQLSKGQPDGQVAGAKSVTLDIERLRLAHPTTSAALPAPVATPPAIATAAPGQGTTGFSSPADFVAKLAPLAEKYAADLGVDPKVLLAQAALETGWGKSVSRAANGVNSNNLFNIKADQRWSGPQALVNTLEYQNGQPLRSQAAFRAYPDYEASFKDYVAFIKSSPRYQQALAQAGNGQAYVRALHSAGYATDPNYSAKINTIMNSDLLSGASA